MKITNVSHYVSAAGKEMCAANIHFIIHGAKLEALAAAGDPVALSGYKNWLKSAEVEKPSHNTRSPKRAKPRIGRGLTLPAIAGEITSTQTGTSAEIRIGCARFHSHTCRTRTRHLSPCYQ